MEAGIRGPSGPAPGATGAPPTGTRRTRRQTLAALGVAAGAALLSACARPLVQQGSISLLFSTYNWGGAAQQLLAGATGPFEQANRGIRVRTIPTGGDLDSTITTLRDGTGPDVFWGQDLAAFSEASALLPLDDYVRRDSLDLDLWPGRKVAMLQTASGLCGLPAYTGVMCYAVRLSDWDSLHLERPSPEWTHSEFATAAAQMTGVVNGHKRHGANVQWYTTWLGDNAWLFPGFGGAQMKPDGSASTLGSVGAITAGAFMYDLLWAGRVRARDQVWDDSELVADNTAMLAVGSWGVAGHAADFASAFEWDYYPFPVFPKGRMTYANADFFGVSARTAHPDAAWELIKWVASGADWQRFVLHAGLMSPGTTNLWDEWVETAAQVAPVLRGKALHSFADAARGNYAQPQMFYRYQDAGAQVIANAYISKLWNLQLKDVGTAFAGADAAINAFLSGAAKDAATATAASTAIARALSSAATSYAVPTRAQAPPAPAIASTRAAATTLRGAGAGLGGTSDACGLIAVTAGGAQAQFTCCLSGLVNISCPSLSPLAFAGLMARADLTPGAPCVVVGARADVGPLVSVRPDPSLVPQLWTADSAPWPGGLVAAKPGKDGNYLTGPIWLRLRRSGATWSTMISADGTHFTPAGPDVIVDMAGCWIGLCATAHNSTNGFKPGQAISATFTDLDFHPGSPVEIGRA